MIKINLVPREILDQEVQKQRTIQAAVAMGLIIAVVAGVSAIQIRKAAALQAKSVELQKEFDRLQAIAAEADELEKQAKAVRAKLDVITSLLKGRGLYPIFMMDFSRTMPGAVWITSLTTSIKDRNALSVSVAASASSSEAISDWIRNFIQSGRFTEPVLSAIAISGGGDGAAAKMHLFSITTNYTNPQL